MPEFAPREVVVEIFFTSKKLKVFF